MSLGAIGAVSGAPAPASTPSICARSSIATLSRRTAYDGLVPCTPHAHIMHTPCATVHTPSTMRHAHTVRTRCAHGAHTMRTRCRTQCELAARVERNVVAAEAVQEDRRQGQRKKGVRARGLTLPQKHFFQGFSNHTIFHFFPGNMLLFFMIHHHAIAPIG